MNLAAAGFHACAYHSSRVPFIVKSVNDAKRDYGQRTDNHVGL